MTAVAIDFETALIRPGLLAPPPVCLTAYDGNLHAANELPLIWHCYLERKGKGLDSYKFLRHILTDANATIVGANIAFDLAVAATEWPDLLPLIFAAYDDERVQDVQIREKLSDIAQGQLDGKWIADDTQPEGTRFIKHLYSLADVAKRHGLADRTSEKNDVDGWRLRYWELRHVPIREWPIAATEYARADAKETWRVYDRQSRNFEPAILNDAARQAAYHFALHLLSCRGLRTDAEKIIALQRSKRVEYADVRRVLVSHGLIRPDDTGPKAQRGTRDIKAAQARMVAACAAAGIEPTLTEKGAICLDADACAAVAPFDEAFAVYARYLTLQNICESQIPALMCGTEKPIQPRFNVLVESGRTSCSAAKPRKGQPTMQFGFQVQNVRREPGIRECFRARQGYFYADADFSGLELCTMAQACVDLLGESKLGEAINAGLDPHLAMGASLIGISYADAVERKHEKEIKHARQLSKIANFGFPGGLGAPGFIAFAHGYGVELTIEQAKELKAKWLEQWPEFNYYFDRVRRMLDKESNRVPLLEQLRSHRYRGECRFTEACNTYFQGLGADVAKHALYEVTKACYSDPSSPLFGSYPVNFVHDQIIAEVPIETAHEACVELGRLMCETANTFWLPDVPVKCEPCLSVWWSKDAVAVYTPDGQLYPWDLAVRDAGKGQKFYYSDGKELKA